MVTAIAVVCTFVLTLAGCAFALRLWRAKECVPAPTGRGFTALRAMGMATGRLTGGLSAVSAEHAAGRLHTLLGCAAVAITDTDGLLGWSGPGQGEGAFEIAGEALRGGRPHRRAEVHLGGTARVGACVAPIDVQGEVVGALVVYVPEPGYPMLRATVDVARLLAGQLALREVQRSRSRLADAELRALRAQISPHFVYNCLNTIASFIRTDPERARNLLAEFADFARYAFRYRKESTSLFDELRSIDRYLLLERARFGDRLHCDLHITPEVLPVAVPFLCLQPLVENAVRHGMEGLERPVHITVKLRDAGPDVRFTVEDDGAGIDPERLRLVLAGRAGASTGIGLANIDQRMRQVYGAAYGLRVETAPGAGTKVSVRIPKFRVGVVRH